MTRVYQEGFCRAFAKQFDKEELSLLEVALSSHLAPSIRLHPDKAFSPPVTEERAVVRSR